MSFESIETSEYGNEPRELYWFMRGAESWTFTSGAFDVVFDGKTFTPVAGLSRGSDREDGERSRSQMTVNMPVDNVIAQMFTGIPDTRPLWLYIYRIHDGIGDFQISWQGRARFCEKKGQVATLTCDNILTSTKKDALRHLYQNQCNHFTFDTNCTLSEADYSVTGVTVSAIDGNFITATNSQAADYYTAGQVKRANGDRRFVVSDTKALGVHTLELLTPFEDMQAGEVVTLIGGACRHTFETCKITKKADGTTVDNHANYGGYNKIPRKNPFKSFH